MIKEKEEQIFADWKKVRSNFTADGVIDETAYITSRTKLLFLMKEVNGNLDGTADLREFLKTGGRSQTWNNISRWIYAIKRIQEDLEWETLKGINTNEKRIEQVKSVCIMNLKKSSGGNTTNTKEFLTVVNEDKAFVIRQFDLYNPDIIIACGRTVSIAFQRAYGIQPNWQKTQQGIRYFKLKESVPFISYFHPAARINARKLSIGLFDAVKEVTGGALNNSV